MAGEDPLDPRPRARGTEPTGDPEPLPDPDLLAVLRAEAALPRPVPDPGFVAELRAAFVGGDFGGDEDPGPALRTTLDADTPAPAREAFRADLRARFLSAVSDEAPAGALAAGSEIPAERRPAGTERAAARAPRPPATAPRSRSGGARREAAPASRSGRRRESAPAPARGSRRRAQLAGLLGTTLVAVALLLWSPWSTSGVASPWSLAPGTQASALRVDGQVLAADLGPAQVAALLAGATRVEALDDRVALQYERRFRVQLGRDSVLDLSAVEATAQGAGRRHELTLVGLGGVQVATGPDFRRGVDRLAVATDEARVEVTGTIFAVDRYDDGTCVCCLEGAVSVRPCHGELDTVVVDAEHMDYVFREPQRMSGDIMPPHREPLVSLRDLGW